ncbi:MAG: murein biosynthesis integral membrane protein MurJ [Phycisphaerae bacterium]|nr:murein biosynthesis integral membrane protein MurJ [Phycisphaerae bacterium]
MDDSSHREREHFFGAAKLVAGLTVLSRILGMVRDMAIWALGASRATDAFWTAFTVPNLFRRLFGEGALSAAFVPVFTEIAEAEGWQKARLVLANAAGLLAIILAGIVVLVELGLLVGLLFIQAWDWSLLLQLTMIVLPFMLTVCLLALGSAALNCKGHFAYPAFAPILLNIFLIAGAYSAHVLLSGAEWEGLFVLSLAVVLAGVVQLLGVIWLLRRVGLAATPSIRPILQAVRRIARLTLPMMVPLGILQFSAFFDRIYAWIMSATPDAPSFSLFGLSIAKPLDDGVVTCLYAANRLYQFPMGILAISLATAVFPLFSRYAARGDIAGLRESTNRSLRLSLFMGVPAGVGLILLAYPAATLICRHGNFQPADANRTASILQMYCLGMWAYFCSHILLRAFFSQKDTSTPLRISCLMAAVNMLMVLVLVFTPLKSRAIGLATAVTASANVVLLTWVLRRRWGRIGFRRISVSLLRTFVATVCMAAAVLAVLQYLPPAARQLAAQWGVYWADSAILVLASIPAGGMAFLLAAAALRCEELRELRGIIGGRTSTDDDAKNKI